MSNITETTAVAKAITITERDGELLADSRDVADALGVEHKNVVELIRKNADDFQVVTFETEKPKEGSTGGRPLVYAMIPETEALLLITYVRNTERAKVAKRALVEAFQAMRRKLTSKPLSSIDMFKQMVSIYEDQERRIKLIEAKLETSQQDFYTIAGYCSLRGLKIDVTKANMMGRKAAKLSHEYGYDIGKANDPRFGQVNTYHVDILAEVIDQE